MTLRVYRPGPADHIVRLKMATRLPALEGRRVGLVGNLKPNCDVLLLTTGDLLVQERGAAGHVLREKSSCSVGAPESMLDEVAGTCDAAVVALGD